MNSIRTHRHHSIIYRIDFYHFINSSNFNLYFVYGKYSKHRNNYDFTNYPQLNQDLIALYYSRFLFGRVPIGNLYKVVFD